MHTQINAPDINNREITIPATAPPDRSFGVTPATSDVALVGAGVGRVGVTVGKALGLNVGESVG